MNEVKSQPPLTILRWALGLVILAEAVVFLLPQSSHAFAKTHLPNVIQPVLGWGEIVGCILLLIPRTAIRGAWFLLAVFVLAVIIHLLHGMYNVGNLLVYAAAAWTLAAESVAHGPGAQA
ncbi:MAG TPA: DoxX family protein [Candidatus Aquilonibacter sp.]|nr:DoxX family protein [Candidatus Aquilonibacter sp.]